MLDMYRCPDKLIAASEKVLNTRIANAVPADPAWTGVPQRGGGPLHRGSDEFMSLKQFEQFYWPGLKRSTWAGIDLGYTVSHFYEGVWDKRLEYLLEFPKGKLIFSIERTDIFRAKEVLGNHCCIQGGVPPALLTAGSPEDVDEYCKKLIKVVGKGGGFILGCGSSIDCAKPANVKAMVDSVRKYRP
jgi:uroporphyrinogen-III decarboxylase